MKIILTFIIALFSLMTYGQQMSLDDWNKEVVTNIRLLPKYGYQPKTDEQKNIDIDFIKSSLKIDTTNRKASDHLIRLGFHHLYNDVKTAMYRFNQAYLLDSTNTDIYWGFGGVYMVLEDYVKAREQYLEGLSIDSQNTHLLTDYGTYFMSQYFLVLPIDEKNALANLDTAIIYMTKSYKIDQTNPNTSFKLSVCYWSKGECENAWKFYNVCKALGGQPITEDYTKDLKKKCKSKK